MPAVKSNGSERGTLPNEASNLRAARGAMPSPWILSLPWVLRGPIIFLYVDMIDADDDFLAQLRKLFFTMAALIAPSALFAGIYNAFTIPDTVSANGWIAKVGACCIATTWMVNYLLARFDLVGAGPLAAFLVFATFLGTFTMTLSVNDWPFFQTMTQIAVAAQVLRVSWLPCALLLCVIGFVVSAHNSAAPARGPPEVALWAIPGAITRDYQTRMLQTMQTLAAAVLVLAGLQLQLLESDKLVRQAQRSSDVALQIAQLLANYDTDSAMMLLEEARMSSDAEPKLIEALEVLVDNLNKYRPHLPNWLVPEHHSREEQQRNAAPAGTPDHASFEQSDDDCSVRSERHSSSSSRRSSASENKRRDAAQALSKTLRVSLSRSSAATQCVSGATFVSFVSIARLRYTFDMPVASEASSQDVRERFQSFQSAIVDTVHRLAGQTAAAVHCFVGDTVLLSWNAASRAVQSEAKAARMAARLLVSASECGVRVHGAVVSGKARVQLAGSEGQQKALTVSAGWLEGRLSAVATVGQRRGCIACDYATRSPAAETIAMRAAEAVVVPVPNGETPLRVACYQVLSEARSEHHRRRPHGSGQWLYVLPEAHHDDQLRETDSGGRIDSLKALDAWARGDDAAAAVELGLACDAASAAVLLASLNAHLGSSST